MDCRKGAKRVKALKVEGVYHWGYWVKGLEVSKLQFSLRFPPPTTLIGAISLPLVKAGYVKNILGEIDRNLCSPAKFLSKIFPVATIALDGYGYYFEDINVYILLHFQGFQKDRETRQVRRYLPKFRRGAILNGRVYAPYCRFTVIYMVNAEKAFDLIGEDWESKIVRGAWEILRIGSKESIVSVEKVSLINVVEEKADIVKTKFYFLSNAATPIEFPYFMEKFWVNGFGRGDKPQTVEYTIPGRRNPVQSRAIRVKLNDAGVAYRLETGEVVISARA